MERTEHTTHVAQLNTKKWRVYCDECGQVGVPEEYEADALAIASRHEEVGGFG